MTRSFRLGSTISLLALSTVLAGCAAPQKLTGFGGKGNGEVGLATRALMALNSSDTASAITYSEQAVQKSPQDFGVRALLGSAYFAGGRFASAEAALKDSLELFSNQPQVVLKLALSQIAQGKNAAAVETLNGARNVLDPADYGLALALAGRPSEALSVLEPAARVQGADARVRQNLALTYAFAGDWRNARTIAAQDVPADQLDSRIHQWMQLAKPVRASDQVAALTGVTPAADDPGQPSRLALRKSDGQPAQAATAAPVPVFEPQPQVAEAAPPPPPIVDSLAPAPAALPAPVAAEVPATIVEAAAQAPSFTAVPPAPPPPRKVSAPIRRASASKQAVPVRNAALRRGNANVVIQLGAYSNAQRVAAAWSTITKRYPALREYMPMTARFHSPKGTVYRLSIKGFSNQQEAIARCRLLKTRGGTCFVRGFAGDAPVQIASR
jgi:Flp pilus assembly protein TadD